jgi:hypothetical protein
LVMNRNEHEAAVQANPDYYTAIAMLGSGRRERREAPTLNAIRAVAVALYRETGRGILIYAVKGCHQSHVENYDPRTRRTPYAAASSDNLC